MDTPVGRLLDLDAKAQSIVDEAQQYYDDTLQEIKREKQLMQERYRDNASSHIEQARRTEENIVAEQRESIRVHFTELQERLDERYNAERNKWIHRLVSHCMDGESQ